MAGVRIEWDAAGWNRLMGDLDQGVAKAAGKVRDDAKRIIAAEGRVDTGRMMNTLSSRRVRQTSNGSVYEVGSDLDYAIYQHEGVRGPVRPRRAKVLRFTGRGGAVVFAPQTAGFSGIKFLTRALEGLRPEDFRW